MINISQAFSIIDQVSKNIATQLQQKQQSEQINTCNSLNRILAAPQFSQLNLPPFDKSAMDGYAITAADQNEKVSEYQVVATIAAGEITTKKLLRGTTIKVMTGAPVPPEAAVIVPIEMVEKEWEEKTKAEKSNKRIKIITWPDNNNICQLGEDVKQSDKILASGTILSPAAIATLIACGITTIPVYRKLRVVIIATGNEIVDDVADAKDAKIMNSNGPMLAALCHQYGLEVIANLIVADNYDSAVKSLEGALDLADIVLFSGGVSAGDFDFVTSALNATGLQIHFNRIAIKPGKPTTFASTVNTNTANINTDTTIPTKLVFGLPGNPVSVYLSFNLFVLRAWRTIFNITPHGHLNGSNIILPLEQDFKRSASQAKRTEYVPCQLTPEGTLMPLKYHGSAHLASLLECDGFFIVPLDITKFMAGDKVSFFITAK